MILHFEQASLPTIPSAKHIQLAKAHLLMMQGALMAVDAGAAVSIDDVSIVGDFCEDLLDLIPMIKLVSPALGIELAEHVAQLARVLIDAHEAQSRPFNVVPMINRHMMDVIAIPDIPSHAVRVS